MSLMIDAVIAGRRYCAVGSVPNHMTLDPPTPDDIVLASDRVGTFDERIAAGVGVLGGLLAAAAGAAPTGRSTYDVLLVFVVAALAIWAAARTAWVPLVAAAGVVTAFGAAPVPIVLGVAAAAAAAATPLLAWRLQQRRSPWFAYSLLHSIAAALIVNAAIRSDIEILHGLSAVVGIGTCGLLAIAGVAARPRRVRRVFAWAAVVVAVAAGTAVALAAIALTAARSDLADGTRDARRAVTAVNQGRYVDGTELLGAATTRFAAADDRLGGGWLAAGEYLPGVSQNLRAVRDLASGAADTLDRAADALEVVDPSKLRLVGGAFDIDEIAAVEAPLQGVETSLVDFRADLTEVESPWLLAPLQNELAEVSAELDDGLPRLANAIDAIELAPALLGDGSERNYLVLFTTPAEARGLGGFVGNYAHVQAVDGRITVTEFGRRQRLDRLLTESGGGRCDTCPDELLRAYGARGLTLGPGGGVADQVWASITEPSHFPYVAEAVAALYPMSGGTELDGVVVADPYTVQALMSFTGPIPVREFDVRVLPRQAARFIIEDQYLLTDDRPERVDALESLAQGVIERLLTDASPTPARLAEALSPMIAERRLLMWSAEPEERALFDRIGLLGALPPPTPDGFSATVTNEGGSKIDAFLERTIEVRVERVDVAADVAADAVDGGDGEPVLEQLVAEVTLTNNAPSSGLPDYVIGNIADLPLGTSQMLVRLYGSTFPEEVLVDGEVVSGRDFTEAGWAGREVRVVVMAGETATIAVRYPPGEGRVEVGSADEFEAPAGEDDDVGRGSDGEVVTPAWLQPLADRSSS
jgi:hypothetical protein